MTPQLIRISLPHLLLLALLPLHAASTVSTARIGVFTLFHPQELDLTPDSATLVYLTSNGRASRFPVTSPIRIRLSGGTLECDIEDQTITADKLELSPRGASPLFSPRGPVKWRGEVRERPVSTRRAPLDERRRTLQYVEYGEQAQRSNGGPIAGFGRQVVRNAGQLRSAHPDQEPPPDWTLTVPSFTLAVPGKIRRRYQGVLEITAAGNQLTAVVSMPAEIAVASIIAAEAVPQAAPAALRAQAVVTRSYLLASPRRHAGYDFCDTTHCQYLREPPPAAHPAAQAARATSGLALTHRGKILPALYSASCGRRTLSARDAGMTAAPYPYFAVDCPPCRRRAKSWKRRLPRKAARPLLAARRTEQARLAVVRALGWSALPSNNYRIWREADTVIIEGRGAGHGVGLCQRGAAALAAQGASFLDILATYLPATEVSLPVQMSPIHPAPPTR